MEEDQLREGMMIDLDLNQEPSNPHGNSVVELGSTSNGTAYGQIEDRIRQLEAVAARARQRQSWRMARNNPETSDLLALEVVHEIAESEGHKGDVSRNKTCKRSSSHLVAKALEMDMEGKKVSREGGSFFDCNVCLNMARDPILTCCGHLFCWACFYELPYVYSTAKECPRCKGEVIEKGITPIYTNEDKTHVSESEKCGAKVPPRPKAQRIESVRQQRVNRGVSLVTVAEALRRIRTGVGEIQQDLDGLMANSERNDIAVSRVSPSTMLPNTEAGTSRRPRTRQFSRVLSESGASLSSLSPALDNAETSVNNLDSVIHNDPSNGTVIQLEQQSEDPVTEITTPTQVNLNVPRPSSSRRRRGASRVSNAENGVPGESTRRRFR